MRYLFCELLNNGKGTEALMYDKAIFIMNTRVCTNGTVIHENEEITFSPKDIAFFSVNEDGMHFIQKVRSNLNDIYERMMKIRNVLVEKKIKIFNDPIHFPCIGNKYLSFENLPKSIVPKYSKFPCDWQHDFPCMVSASIASGGRHRYLCENHAVMTNKGNLIKRIKQDVFVMDYIDSYNDELQCFLSLRLMVINNVIIDWFNRPGKHWNIHTRTQDVSKLQLADEWFKKWMHHNNDTLNAFVNKIYAVFGDGAYALDCIITKQNEIKLCEIGYKFWDDTYAKLINLNKCTKDLQKYKETINKVLI